MYKVRFKLMLPKTDKYVLCRKRKTMGPPVLYETMVFGGPHDGDMCRYVTWDEAVAGHDEMLRRVQHADPPF